NLCPSRICTTQNRHWCANSIGLELASNGSYVHANITGFCRNKQIDCECQKSNLTTYCPNSGACVSDYSFCNTTSSDPCSSIGQVLCGWQQASNGTNIKICRPSYAECAGSECLSSNLHTCSKNGA